MLAGAGTRVPRVQDRLVKDLKSSQPLGRSLNTDEAAALGAAYKAADLSNGFKVKPFITKDATLFPIQVNYFILCNLYSELYLLIFTNLTFLGYI
jgi:hypoxia up-regulated 1